MHLESHIDIFVLELLIFCVSDLLGYGYVTTFVRLYTGSHIILDFFSDDAFQMRFLCKLGFE